MKSPAPIVVPHAFGRARCALTAAVFCTLLWGCGAKPTVATESTPPDPPPDPGVVAVFPLTQPEALVLLEQARSAAAVGKIDAGYALVQRALEITPRDPELWQYLAELALLAGNNEQAADHARYAFAMGPRVGPICYRNWHTLGVAFARMGQSREASEASARAQQCTLQPGPRY